MKVRLVDQIKREDALVLANPDTTEMARFSEWHHFTFNDDEHGLYGIFNLALTGNIYNPAEARAGVSLVVYDWRKGWHGTVNLYSLRDAQFSAGSIDLQIGDNSVRFKKDCYQVRAALRDGTVELKAAFTPEDAPVRLDNLGGRISTFIAPRMAVNGEILINGRSYSLESAVGYHDHNWGYWHWGKEIGWDWGYILQSGPQRKRPTVPRISVVFGRVTDAGHTAKSDLVLMVWMEGKFSEAFVDKAVTISYAGELTGVRIPRIPGPLALLDPRSPAGIPKHIKIEVEEGDDHLVMLLEVEGASQFLIPHPVWKAVTTITEMVGTYTITGEIRGYPFNFSFRGFAELAG